MLKSIVLTVTLILGDGTTYNAPTLSFDTQGRCQEVAAPIADALAQANDQASGARSVPLNAPVGRGKD